MGCDIHIIVELKQEDGTWKAVAEPGRERYEDGQPRWNWEFYRQTACFAVLADVRNGDDMKFISEPRGLPDDRDLKDEFRYGDHSYSWLLFPEILGFDWNQKIKQKARIPKDQADEIKAGLLTRPVIRKPTTEEFAEAEWEETYADACSNLMIFIRHLRAVFSGIDPERIRIVFGFDS